MKIFRTKQRSSLLLTALLAFPVWAKPIAQVKELAGAAFVISADGKTKSLKSGDHLDVNSEVMVDEGASITLNDYYDATYHLTGGSHVKFFDKSVQLKRGKSWVQSASARHPLALTTANGHVDFWKGEFITTFDQTNSRSQVLVVNGDVEVSNILDKNLKYMVPAGTFTLIDPEVENGSPRAPTKVGLASLNSALGEFKSLPEKLEAPARGVASVEEAPAKKGEIIFIQTNRLPASVEGGAHSYWKKKAKAKKSVLGHAPIRFYGVTPVTTPVAKETPRVPASIAPIAPQKSEKPKTEWKIDPEFSESLKTQQVEQPKHSEELQSLIEDLESY